VLDVLASTLSADTHAKSVFTILIIPAVPLTIISHPIEPRLVTISLSAGAKLVGTAQLLPYTVLKVGTLLFLLHRLAEA